MQPIRGVKHNGSSDASLSVDDAERWIGGPRHRLEIPLQRHDFRLTHTRIDVDLAESELAHSVDALAVAQLRYIVVRRVGRLESKGQAETDTPVYAGREMHRPELDAGTQAVAFGGFRDTVRRAGHVELLDRTVEVK